MFFSNDYESRYGIKNNDKIYFLKVYHKEYNKVLIRKFIEKEIEIN
jgi:Ser/Thr protein kinase RdoA (MazF antagonist)